MSGPGVVPRIGFPPGAGGDEFNKTSIFDWRNVMDASCRGYVVAGGAGVTTDFCEKTAKPSGFSGVR